MAFPSSSSNQSQQQQQLKAPSIEEEGGGGAQGKKNLIILVDKDSNDKLDELFEQTLSNKTTLHKPYKMRKLPASFFQPPSSGSKSPSVSHSRENSADSAFGSGTTILGSNNTATPPNSIPSKQPATNPVTRELIHHSRAHSSPASLGKLPPNINLNLSALTLGSATQASPTHPNSGNPTSNPNTPNKHQPSSKLSSAILSSNPSIITSNTILDKTMQHNHSRGRSYDISSLQQQLHFGDLPPGWEQAKTHDGKIYYINHNTRTTQWQDPRTDFITSQSNLFSSSSENSSVETIFSNPVGSSSQNSTETQSQSSNATAVISPTSPVGQLVINGNINLTPLEWPWEESVTENGERYYINHLTRTTTWRDPRLSSQEWEQNLRIYNLQLERERLKTRRQEIAKLSIGEDPFLPGITDHARQESGDSGLSAPDYMSTIDDSMDGVNANDSSLDVMESFNEAMETPDDFMLNDPLLLEKIDGLM